MPEFESFPDFQLEARAGGVYVRSTMGGTNPYLPERKVPKATKPFKVTFMPMNKTIEVDPAKIPYDDNGLPGSLLDIAMAHGINIDHACGGVSACSTCHVHVRKGLKTCNEAIDEELDQLDNAPKTSFDSRLACQCVANGSEDLVVEIPGWNRNAVSEGH
ncbi:MAG: 2Fe-2S iron-sulfur cluster binding domain-containing protein [Bdellovibrionales bacterium]|nr:2Fe-2S iron-sulfur cluster binding domain-containing protein [Bdellovibrionales bacterium]